MNDLIVAIHHDLMDQRGRCRWLAQFSDKCLTRSQGRFWILYYPTVSRGTGQEPQQPDHLMLTCVSLDQDKGFKYFSDFDKVGVCRFPQLHAKVYGQILCRASDHEQTERLIRGIVIRRCSQLQREIKKPRSAAHDSIRPTQ